MTLFAVIVFCTISIITGTTTKAHHGHHHHTANPIGSTKEPIEKEDFSFKYDPVSHVMVAKTHQVCYIYKMTQQEIVDVHTTHGLRTLEIKMLQAIDDGTGITAMSLNELNAIDPSLSHHFCKTDHTYNKLTIA